MTMFLYLVKPKVAQSPTDRIEPWGWDCTYGVVVRAANSAQARVLAASVAGDEGAAVWHDTSMTSCKRLKTTGPSMVILRDSRDG